MAEISEVENDGYFGVAPVQIEGRLADGRFFYFRSRGQEATFTASPVSSEHAVELLVSTSRFGKRDRTPADHTVVRDLSHLGEFMAGGLDCDEALALAREMAAELPAVEEASCG